MCFVFPLASDPQAHGCLIVEQHFRIRAKFGNDLLGPSLDFPAARVAAVVQIDDDYLAGGREGKSYPVEFPANAGGQHLFKC